MQKGFIDSLIARNDTPAIYRVNETDLRFWKDRIQPGNPGLVSELRYASCLVQRFHLRGDIQDLVTADSILRKTDLVYAHKEVSPVLALIRNCILRHRFKEADSLLQAAKKLDVKPYDAISTSFDVAFELGQYLLAETGLRKIADRTDYGYNFRYARQAHYKGELDSSIDAMLRAAAIAGDNIILQQAALSNAADLCLHSGNLQKAYELYGRSVRLSNADLHSLMGIGWIALVHDGNDSMAERIFRSVQARTQSPDVLLRLEQVAEKRGDSARQMKYARQFESIVTRPVYGNMYNKYLVELYTGILNDPLKAETIARKELANRSTPQTYAWYAWALYTNHKTADAQNIYDQYVSGKPLEGLELYWMGMLMKGQGKGYNAQSYFKAAYKNRYDLGPGIVNDLELKPGN